MIVNGYVQFKNHSIPVMQIDEYVNSHEDLLLSASMQDLKDIYVFGLPSNFEELLLKKIKLYDTSSAIEGFYYKGKEYWLDKTQRASITNLLNICSEDSIEIVLGEEVYTFSKEALTELLANLEWYAHKCKVTTQKHINNIKALQLPTNQEEYEEFIKFLINYDYTSDYPEKLVID